MPSRRSCVLLLVIMSGQLSFAWAQVADPGRTRLDKARATYDAEIEKLRAVIEQHFAKIETAVKGDATQLAQVAAERVDFTRNLELPLSVPSAVRIRFIAVRQAYMTAAQQVLQQYTRERKTTEAAAAESEIQAIREKSAGLEVDPSAVLRIPGLRQPVSKYAVNRVVAEAARKGNARLAVRILGPSQVVNLADPLPSEPFVVMEVHFPEGAKVSDDDLGLLCALSDLTHLAVRGSDVTDRGVARLAALRQLKFINLHATNVTDQSLFVLSKLGTLEEVDVGYNQNLSDQALRTLVGTLSKLRRLTFNSQHVTPESARWIQTQLQSRG